MKMGHGEDPSEIESEHSEINDEHHACPFCGLLFTSDSTLQDHIRKCPRKPIPTSNIFGVHDEDDEENEDAWVYLIRHCNANIINSFEESRNTLLQENLKRKLIYLQKGNSSPWSNYA